MKLHFKKREDGSTLFVAMTICLIVGLILSGYLVLSSNRFLMTTRSADWNAAIPVLEAGIEEAMTHLTRDTNLTANNWVLTNYSGSQVYAKKRIFSDGSYFDVKIYDSNNSTNRNPVIYSQGSVRSPFHANQYISRLVKVDATNPPTIFTKAIAANGAVNMIGVPLVDGFDSRVGGYNTSTNRNAQGDIATNSKLIGAVAVANGNVYGHVSVGPGGTITVGSGAVGDVAWNASHSGFEPGWTDSTMNVAYPSNSPPTGGVALSSFTNVTSGTYQISSYTSSGNMVINGQVTLYVTGSFTIKGNDYIQIMPGGSLKLVLGSTGSINGGGVLNNTGVASNFSIVGLSSCTSISYGGNAAFNGTINAPQSVFSLSGTSDAYGAIIANTVSMNGNTGFHYDVALAYASHFVVTSWKEL